MQRQKILLINNNEWSWGMAVHWRFVYESIKNIYNVFILNEFLEPKKSQDFIEQFDLIIRYSWHQKDSTNFENANFTRNISHNINKNILILFSDSTLFHPSPIKEINKYFSEIWWDSYFCFTQWKKEWLNMQFYTNIGFDLLSDNIAIDQRNNDFLHICSRESQIVKWTDFILKAFYDTFRKDDDINLTIITNKKTIHNDMIWHYNNLFIKEKRNNQLNIIENKICHNEMNSIYQTHKTYINASRLETFWIPPLESLQNWLNLISPNQHGMSEYLQHLDYIEVKWDRKIMKQDTRRKNKETIRFEPSIQSLQESLIKSLYYKSNIEYNKNQIKKHYSKEIVTQNLLEKIKEKLSIF